MKNSNKKIDEENPQTKEILTRGTIKLIETAIERLDSDKKSNRNAICYEISNIMLNTYVANSFDYQSNRMGLKTSKDILEKIDIYFYKYLKVKN